MFDGLLQPTHLIIILVIVLIIFGPGKLPELGSALGRGIKEFRGGIKEASEDLDINTPPTTTTASAPSAPVMTAPTAPTAIPSTGMTATSMPAPGPTVATMPQGSPVLSPSMCVKCGTPLGAGVHFCPNCGNKIEATA